jgi:UDP-N-acetylmuramyl pentapeptide phosphotransferase/UDP-N-acetylglucosamine-1-phosphate transferase
MFLIIVALSVFLTSILGTKYLINFLIKHQIIAQKNERTNHETPTPVGAGMVMIPIILVGWYIIAQQQEFNLPYFTTILCLATILLIISFFDDIRHISPIIRIITQIAIIIPAIIITNPEGMVFRGYLPPLLDQIISGFLWLWFVNLYNFMDGIDGITATETIFITVGIIILAIASKSLTLLPIPDYILYLSIIILVTTLGFLPWNWHPAKIFLGDSGAVPLGFLIGFLLLKLAISGYLAAALILPAYYVADSSLTITKRLLRLEKIWLPHSKHFFQKSVRKGRNHSETVNLIRNTNIILIIIALTTAKGELYNWLGLSLAAITVAILLYVLAKGKQAT